MTSSSSPQNQQNIIILSSDEDDDMEDSAMASGNNSPQYRMQQVPNFHQQYHGNHFNSNNNTGSGSMTPNRGQFSTFASYQGSSSPLASGGSFGFTTTTTPPNTSSSTKRKRKWSQIGASYQTSDNANKRKSPNVYHVKNDSFGGSLSPMTDQMGSPLSAQMSFSSSFASGASPLTSQFINRKSADSVFSSHASNSINAKQESCSSGYLFRPSPSKAENASSQKNLLAPLYQFEAPFFIQIFSYLPMNILEQGILQSSKKFQTIFQKSMIEPMNTTAGRNGFLAMRMGICSNTDSSFAKKTSTKASSSQWILQPEFNGTKKSGITKKIQKEVLRNGWPQMYLDLYHVYKMRMIRPSLYQEIYTAWFQDSPPPKSNKPATARCNFVNGHKLDVIFQERFLLDMRFKTPKSFVTEKSEEPLNNRICRSIKKARLNGDVTFLTNLCRKYPNQAQKIRELRGH